jgi:hypothetical protein
MIRVLDGSPLQYARDLFQLMVHAIIYHNLHINVEVSCTYIFDFFFAGQNTGPK